MEGGREREGEEERGGERKRERGEREGGGGRGREREGRGRERKREKGEQWRKEGGREGGRESWREREMEVDGQQHSVCVYLQTLQVSLLSCEMSRSDAKVIQKLCNGTFAPSKHVFTIHDVDLPIASSSAF